MLVAAAAAAVPAAAISQIIGIIAIIFPAEGIPPRPWVLRFSDPRHAAPTVILLDAAGCCCMLLGAGCCWMLHAGLLDAAGFMAQDCPQTLLVISFDEKNPWLKKTHRLPNLL